MTDTTKKTRAQIQKSQKLDYVLYDIRGPVLQRATEIEESGAEVIKLHIGNPAPFGFDAPDHILREVERNIKDSHGYSESKGLLSAREALCDHYNKLKVPSIDPNDIYIGNGVSELIVMALQGLINNGDEVLIPAPDYPLWTAATSLCGGSPKHYFCDESEGWQPDLDDIRRKISQRTKAIVIINPNNPTGSVYSKKTLESLIELARHNNLVVFSDEIYDKILFDDSKFHPTATLSEDVLIITFSGLSKSYQVAGFRTGWLVISGQKKMAEDYIEGLELLSSMRLCSNVPTQHAIATALEGNPEYLSLTKPGGRLYEQRNLAYQRINQIEGISCEKPMGGFYVFPKLDIDRFKIKSDEKFVLDLLEEKQVLVVQGSGFNWSKPDHFRIVFLPELTMLDEALSRIEDFLSSYQQTIKK